MIAAHGVCQNPASSLAISELPGQWTFLIVQPHRFHQCFEGGHGAGAARAVGDEFHRWGVVVRALRWGNDSDVEIPLAISAYGQPAIAAHVFRAFNQHVRVPFSACRPQESPCG